MTPVERGLWAKGAIIKIHVITGWVVPSNELLNVLVDQFEKKMLEGYPTLNGDEFEYAFRTYGTTVKDWGKQMNLSLIDEVLIPYMEARRNVSAIEEQANARLLDSPKEDVGDQAMSEWFEDLRKRTLRLEFLPLMIYDWLEKKERIKKTAAEKYEYLQQAVAYRQSKLAKAFEEQMNQDNRDALHAFIQMKETGEFKGAEVNNLKALAKRMILYDYIMELKEYEKPDDAVKADN